MRSSLYTAAAVAAIFSFALSVLSAPSQKATTPLQDYRGILPLPSASFECVLPYVSRSGLVTIVSASTRDMPVEINMMNAYQYNIVVPMKSSYTFEAPAYKGLNAPIVDGGPISFKSREPIAVSTVLTDSSLTVRCSELNQRTKLFAGTARTRIALVNTTGSPMTVQVFRDNEQRTATVLTMAAKERKLLFLENLVADSGMHAYRVVADSDGFGFAVISGR